MYASRMQGLQRIGAESDFQDVFSFHVQHVKEKIASFSKIWKPSGSFNEMFDTFENSILCSGPALTPLTRLVAFVVLYCCAFDVVFKAFLGPNFGQTHCH